ncbi:hypothetical protein IFM89_003783 [Coptis chinensis]|uniref:RanBP2-type domain-containing protein n=1 Tax=Coptis chinensis TaxID=261450 RepID=A0A835LYA8_9MAGN|nr:hypothetical protein IFM89_003783 [Coptis chinensis]
MNFNRPNKPSGRLLYVLVYVLGINAIFSDGSLSSERAKQWRDGDWMCTNCSNHNYASWSQCNRYVSVLLYLSSGSLQLSYSIISL